MNSEGGPVSKANGGEAAIHGVNRRHLSESSFDTHTERV
jgi:hypothetical protein